MSDDSSLVRTGLSYSPNSYHLITDQLAQKVIFIIDYFHSERLFRVSPNEGTSFSDSFFYFLFFDNNAEGDHVVVSRLTSSQVAGNLTLLALLTPKIQVVILNRVDAKDYLEVYRKSYNQYPIN